jgi:hypothetical protein
MSDAPFPVPVPVPQRPRHQHHWSRKFAHYFPMPGVLLIVYNLMLIGGNTDARLTKQIVAVTLLSGATWTLQVGHLLLVFGLFALYFEMLKATRSTASVPDHVMSLLAFAVYLIEFIAVKGCGTSIFLLLGIMSLVDVMAGFTISIVAARRDMSFSGGDN